MAGDCAVRALKVTLYSKDKGKTQGFSLEADPSRLLLQGEELGGGAVLLHVFLLPLLLSAAAHFSKMQI